MRDGNRELLLSAARVLRPLLDELVFVGGCVTGLLITDEAVPAVRTTFDVDAIAAIVSYHEYTAFAQRLRSLGFIEDSGEGAPLCRWNYERIVLDVMPLDPKILGFSNRWYKSAMQAAEYRILEPSLRVRGITAPYFLATKLEAFHGRGGRDYFANHDLEDVLSVIDGRAELPAEVQAASNDVRASNRCGADTPVCSAETHLGARRACGHGVEKSLDPAGTSACATSVPPDSARLFLRGSLLPR
jgi:hypothetical protein